MFKCKLGLLSRYRAALNLQRRQLERWRHTAARAYFTDTDLNNSITACNFHKSSSPTWIFLFHGSIAQAARNNEPRFHLIMRGNKLQ